jgi:hypothetical protein
MRGKTHSVYLTPHEVSRVQIWELTNGLFFSFKKKQKTKTEFQLLFFFITLGKEERSSLKGDKGRGREEEG